MNFLEYPIINCLRYPLLSTEWIIMIIAFELGIFFLIKYKRQIELLKKSQEFGYFLLFFCYGLMRLSRIISDFYSIDLLHIIFVNLKDLSMIVGALLFIFSLEKYRKYFLKKYFFSLSFLILAIIFFFVKTYNSNFLILFYFIIWIYFFIFLLFHLIDLINKMRYIENVTSEILKMLPSIIFLLIGNAFALDFFTNYLGLELRLLGNFLQIISLCLFFNFFYTHPFIFEFNWKQVVEDIYIMNKNGASLFHKSFTPKSTILDDSLVTGAMSSISIILKEVTRSKEKGISIIKKKGMIIYIYSSKYIIGVLITKDEIKYIKFFLKKFIKRIEMIFTNVLEDWNGDLHIFSPIEFIIEEMFPK